MIAAGRFLAEQASFRRLWIATTISELGSAVARIAFILLVHERAVARGGPAESANAWMLIAETLPMIVFGPVAGALVDRCDRRALLVAANAIQALLLGCVPFAWRLESTWPLYVLAMLVATISTLFPPARQSAIPDLVGVERVATANAISSSTTSFVFVVGAGLAGLMIDRFGKQGCFWLAAASLALASLWLVALALPRRGVAKHGALALVREVLEGMRYVRSRPTLAYITACYFMAFVFIGIWFPLVPEYLRRDLGVDADVWMPRSWMAFGIGGIVGGACGPYIGRALGLGRALVLVYFVEPFVIMAYHFAHSAPVMIALSFGWGMLAFAYFVQEQTILHQDVPAELRGRVFGTLPPLQALGTLVANVIVLAEAGRVAPRTMMLLAGASYLVMSVVFTRAMSGGEQLWNRPRVLQRTQE